MKKTRRFFALLCVVVMSLMLMSCGAAPAGKTEAEPKEVPAVMPVIRINTADGSNDFATRPTRDSKFSDEIVYVDATVSVDSDSEQYSITDAVAKVKVRGNWTLNYPKKSLRIKFDEKQNMLGLNDGQKFKNWVLLAEWKDVSMCNTATALYLADALLGEDGYYCTDYLFAEVYLNDTYWGVYLLAEQQEVKEGRVSVPEPEKNYTGTDIGYFFEYDGYYLDESNIPDGDPTFEIDYGNFAIGKPGSVILGGYKTDGMHGYTVKSDIYSDEQLAFIASYVENVYKILYSAVCEDTHYVFSEDRTGLVPAEDLTSFQVISEVIDVQSLVDTYLLHEIVIDPDIGWSSFYMSVDMSETGDGKLTLEAPWDFDSCFGLRDGWQNWEGMYARDTWNPNPWLSILHEEEWFIGMVKDRWAELKAGGVPEAAIERVRTYKELYKDNFAGNFVRWEERITAGNEEVVPELRECRTQGEAADYLCDWLQKRFDYLDKWLGE